MLLNVHCISLRVVRHSDSTTIVTAWSRERGRITFAVPAGGGREAQRRRALMMPLSLFEGVASIKPGHEISTIREVRSYLCGNVSASDPIKNIVAMFVADFLCGVMRESQPDDALTDFIFEAVGLLGSARGVALANFPLYFIFRLGHFLGIQPDMGTYAEGRGFDMREGLFVASPPLHRAYIDPVRAKVIHVLARISPRTLGKMRLNRRERNEILDAMLEYYSLHHSSLLSLPSLQILRAVLD